METYEERAVKTVSICDTQPLTSEGVRALLSSTEDLRFLASSDSLATATRDILLSGTPDIVILDNAFGRQAVMDWLSDWRVRHAEPNHAAIVVWGMRVSEADSVGFLRAGARGIITKTASSADLLACLRAVARGHDWMDGSAFGNGTLPERVLRGELTSRESQVLNLVERGLTNKEIGFSLGICPGTVKIHVKHLFQKTGVHGRHGLALSGIRERDLAQLSLAVLGER